MPLSLHILLIDFCNFEDYPIGGYLSMAKNLMQSIGNQLQLVGITTVKQDPVGKWYKKEIDGVVYDFFALARYNQAVTKHLKNIYKEKELERSATCSILEQVQKEGDRLVKRCLGVADMGCGAIGIGCRGLRVDLLGVI